MPANFQQIETLFFKLLRAYQKIEPYKEAYDTATETFGNAVKQMERAIKGDIISSDNEDVNRLWAIAKSMKKKLSGLVSKDENYWIEKSKGNLLNKSSIRAAIIELRSIITDLDEMQQVSEACKALLVVLNVNDHMDIKGVASALVSTKALDIEARRLAYKDYTNCIEYISKIKLSVNLAMKAFQKWQ
jgi:hypothetical protein